jgi:hypothetical protein
LEQVQEMIAKKDSIKQLQAPAKVATKKNSGKNTVKKMK